MHERVPDARVTQLLADLRPATVTIIGRVPELDPGAFGDDPVITTLSAAEHQEISRLGIQDLVAVGETLEHLPTRDGLRLLAGLRDLYARRTLLRLALHESDWTQGDLISLGFSRLWHDGRGLAYYGFDVGTYKTTPDWLNPRNWANPELFGRYRW